MAQDKNRSKPTISVIVPVYNVEAYLRQCIDSILAQTFTDFELILVNDGSSDNCGPICDEYAEKDTRITVIHQENGGVSAARNAGLDWVFANSNSQWITFVDSDDRLAPIMLETLLDEAVKQRVDISQTFLEFFKDDEKLSHAGKHVGSVSCTSGIELVKSYYQNQGSLFIGPVGKLIRRGLMQNIRFPVGKIHEDQAIIPILFFSAEKVAVIRSWLYFYRERAGSITHSNFSAKRFDDVDAIKSCVSFFESHGEKHIAKLARRYCKPLWARMVWTARLEGVYSQVPTEYRMGIIRALWILFVSSLQRGGLRFVMERFKKLISQLKL